MRTVSYMAKGLLQDHLPTQSAVIHQIWPVLVFNAKRRWREGVVHCIKLSSKMANQISIKAIRMVSQIWAGMRSIPRFPGRPTTFMIRSISCTAKYSISEVRFSARFDWNWIIGFVFSPKILKSPKPDANSLIQARRLCGNVDRLLNSRAQTCRTVKAVKRPPLLSYLNYCFLSGCKTERMRKFGDVKLVLSGKTATRKYVSF
jgi:hypothetical protein